MKSQTRKIAEKVAKENGRSLVWVNAKAHELVEMGLAKTQLEALKYFASDSKEGNFSKRVAARFETEPKTLTKGKTMKKTTKKAAKKAAKKGNIAKQLGLKPLEKRTPKTCLQRAAELEKAAQRKMLSDYLRERAIARAKFYRSEAKALKGA